MMKTGQSVDHRLIKMISARHKAIVDSIARRKTDFADLRERHKAEIAELRKAQAETVQQIAAIADPTARLDVVRICYETGIAPAKMLAQALFGHPNLVWHMRFALRRPVVTCGRCGLNDVTITRRNFGYPAQCDDCRRRDESAWQTRQREEEARAAHQVRRLRDLRAKSRLSDQEVGELAALVYMIEQEKQTEAVQP